MGLFDREIATYQAELSRLLDHVSDYVLIKDTVVLGFFPTRSKALEAGYSRFLDEPFLVRQILPVEPIHAATRGLHSG